jgi:hypothetical protein
VIGLAFSIFGVILWIFGTIAGFVVGAAIAFEERYYEDLPPRWVGVLMMLAAVLSGSFALAALISS